MSEWGCVVVQPYGSQFGALLKGFRERRGVSQSKLAERANFDHSYVSRLESGSRMPTRDAVDRLGMALGLFASAFARTEFQAVQFMPLFVMPQVLLCGLFAPREAMAEPLEWLSDVMPLSYAVDALTQVTRSAEIDGTLVRNVVIVALCGLAALVGGAATLRRRTP